MANEPADPSTISELYRRAVTLQGAGRLREAESAYREILQLAPEHPDALHALGIVAYQSQNYEAAEQLIGQAIALRPDFADALNNRGNALMQLNRQSEALASFDQAVQAAPQRADFLSNRSVAFLELQRFDDALSSSNLALQINPDDPIAHYNRGNALLELMRLDEAVASYERALAQQPGNADAWCNRGIALQHLQRTQEALESFARALEINPEYVKAHWNRSLCLLLVGDFQRGWREYEWRHRLGPLASATRKFSQPLWLGDADITGKTVLLHAEQGLGDTIQFSRYAAMVAARGARVLLEVQPPLKTLLAGLTCAAQVLAVGEPLPPFDFHCPLLSLPLAFQTVVSTIPASGPYVHADPALISPWQKRLGRKTGLRVGLIWAGDARNRNDRSRSVAVSQLAPLLTGDMTLVSLQRGLRDGDREWLAQHPKIIHLGDALGDFADTAALISLMDVVVSVDTAFAHLAGAMGKETWVLLPFAGQDWRWLLGRNDSPWYPTVTLFRQPKIGDWHSVIAQLTEKFGRMAAG